ncbi:MAG: hypothetical protein ABSF92_10115 [Candidatus Acidiferrales bacterium]|jgi:hypothetical protein
MSDGIIIQYVGFEAKALVREYRFQVRLTAVEPREFTLAIGNDAFSTHRVRFQDAPDICSHRLHHELAVYANHPPETSFRISNEELDEYRISHLPKAQRSLYPSRAARES